MKFRPRSSNDENQSSQPIRSRSWPPYPGKSKRSTPGRPSCEEPGTVAGVASRSWAHCMITSWSVVTRLRPGRSGWSSTERISCEYFSDLDEEPDDDGDADFDEDRADPALPDLPPVRLAA